MRVGGTGPTVGGQFVPRDPARQYGDGMSLYQYGASTPAVNVDPMGLASKPSTQCTKNGAPFKMYFDGLTLRGGGNSWNAISGKPLSKKWKGTKSEGAAYWDIYDFEFDYVVDRQKMANVGGIPTGEYWLDVCEESSARGQGHRRQAPRHVAARDAWGSYSVPLHAETGTETYGRSGFFIHGGSRFGSAGCIDIRNSDSEFDALLEQAYKESCKCCFIPVQVQYTYRWATIEELGDVQIMGNISGAPPWTPGITPGSSVIPSGIPSPGPGTPGLPSFAPW